MAVQEKFEQFCVTNGIMSFLFLGSGAGPCKRALCSSLSITNFGYPLLCSQDFILSISVSSYLFLLIRCEDNYLLKEVVGDIVLNMFSMKTVIFQIVMIVSFFVM